MDSAATSEREGVGCQVEGTVFWDFGKLVVRPCDFSCKGVCEPSKSDVVGFGLDFCYC